MVGRGRARTRGAVRARARPSRAQVVTSWLAGDRPFARAMLVRGVVEHSHDDKPDAFGLSVVRRGSLDGGPAHSVALSAIIISFENNLYYKKNLYYKQRKKRLYPPCLQNLNLGQETRAKQPCTTLKR
jgi:hypothetical protein